MVDERSPADAAGHDVGERDREPAAGDGVTGRYQLAADGTVVAVDDGFCRLTGYRHAEVVGEHVSTLFGDDGSERYGAALGKVRQRGELCRTDVAVTLDTAGGDRIPCTVHVQALGGESGMWSSVGEFDPQETDETPAASTAGQDGPTAGGAEPSSSLTDRIRALSRELGTASTRAELAECVCEWLVALPQYGAAWVGRSHCSDAVLEPEATAEVEGVTLRTDGDGPVGRAVATAEVQVTATDAAADLPAALADTGTTVAAVPLVHGETVYGLLVVTATAEGALGPAERAAFADVGTVVGHALCCLRARRTLMTGRVTEVTLRVRDGGSVLSALSERLDCRVTVEGVVSTPDGRPRHYVTVHAPATDRIRAVGADWPAVERFEIVSEHDDACVVTVEPPEPTLHRVTAEHGGSVRDLVFECGDARVTIELPDADGTRELLAALRAKFETVTLAAQRETDRSIQTRRQFRSALLDRLSDRQQTALRLAYRAGYFNWPRESTGEDIAASMDVSAPTFHKHLRHAEEKLASAVVAPEEGY
ncbi:bacterio-opsin activator domain-containing protein [Halorientalis pallida]|uniref:PAS domain-containing protein n=1 Tax=Halorientalis pallida TaxID=2479928 RepID=A0A498KR53_9EURY|nr:bacterio-opsin activator domain-containing protein [Halorientalis pallida]RXK46456.1 PAS domain-containing protein [Halorientalis pallida]